MEKVNKSLWWHVPPRDPKAYKKRGKFFASTFAQAEFYGRPNDIPEKVMIKNPVWGYSETEILKILFPERWQDIALDDTGGYDSYWYEKRIALDSKMYKAARSMRFDAIVLLSKSAKKYLERNHKPPSIELNLLEV